MINRRTIHIFDDAIIVNDTIELYKKTKIPNQIFYVISNSNEIWGKTSSDVKMIPHNNETPTKINSVLQDNDIVFMQALSYEKAKAIYKNTNPTIHFIWALWGYGLYNILDYNLKQNNKYSTKTSSKKSIVDRLKEWYAFKIVYPKAIKKIKTCLFLLEADYNALKKVIPTKANWMTSCYQTLNNIFGETKEFSVTGNSILLGNSSTPSNNHLKVLELIKLNKNQELIVPLSYGDKVYKKQVVQFGRQKFGDNFIPIIDFVPLKQYMNQLNNCQYTIMGHYRQQAFGTILMMILAGSKLFLSKFNPLYKWFKNKGVLVYSVEEELGKELNTPLSIQQKENNKKRLSSFMNETLVCEQLESIVENAKSKS
jgi:hypothetical protein